MEHVSMDLSGLTFDGVSCFDLVFQMMHFDSSPSPLIHPGCDRGKADQICCFNRHYAEHSGYFQNTVFLSWIKKEKPKEITFYDTVRNNRIFLAALQLTSICRSQESPCLLPQGDVRWRPLFVRAKRMAGPRSVTWK